MENKIKFTKNWFGGNNFYQTFELRLSKNSKDYKDFLRIVSNKPSIEYKITNDTKYQTVFAISSFDEQRIENFVNYIRRDFKTSRVYQGTLFID